MNYLQDRVINQFEIENLIIQKVYDVETADTYTAVIETRPYTWNCELKVAFELTYTTDYLEALKLAKRYLKGMKK